MNFINAGLAVVMDNVREKAGFDNISNASNQFFAEVFIFSEKYRQKYEINHIEIIEAL